uniref:hypothetical protein n=1 Tax=Acetatifactor sp. TaxID=1872090 RepID=UPI00405697D9
MQKQLFESFYNGNVEKIIKQVLSKNPSFSYVRNLEGVYEEYLNQKTALRYLIKNNTDADKAKDSVLLDGHKVSACLTCAIIKARLVVNNDVDDDEGSPYSLDDSTRMNEQIALFSGLSCLMEYMIEDKEFLSVDPQEKNTIDLFFPETKYPERSTYLDSLIRGLYYSNLLSSINPLLMAHIYFMIEQYHRKCVELEIVKKLVSDSSK